ncbi:MAG: PKD domain-containing protein, partial [Bacteroidota bacterium]
EDFEARQFPEFAPSENVVFSELSFTYLDSCLNDITKFVPSIVPAATNVFWEFGDGNVSQAHSPVHTYDTPGGFNVTMTAELNGQRRSFVQMITIAQNDLMIQLGNDTTICPGEVLTLDAGMDAVQYLWSTGEITQTIEVDTTGTYWVQGTSAGGCTAFDEIEVTTYRDPTIFYNQWYFGEQAGIEFEPEVTAIADENLMDSPEGCASFSDVNGDLLFYTNGNTVWNKDHLIMQNGDSIGGDSTATQAAIAVQAPYETTVYYIFTTSDISEDSSFFSYSIVDMKFDRARGRVVAKNIPLFFNSTERVTVSDFFNNIDVLVHEVGNNVFRNYPVNLNGIGNPSFHPIGTIHDENNDELSLGYMKFSHDNNFIAVPLQEETGNFIEIFDYDAQLDSISNPRSIYISEPL